MNCKKLLAFISSVCPMCNIKRKFPNSSFARMMKKGEKCCPCCKAYEEIYGKMGDKNEEEQNTKDCRRSL
ncbi:MAG: hypothetical protein AB1414_17040 [bacterium]